MPARQKYSGDRRNALTSGIGGEILEDQPLVSPYLVVTLATRCSRVIKVCSGVCFHLLDVGVFPVLVGSVHPVAVHILQSGPADNGPISVGGHVHGRLRFLKRRLVCPRRDDRGELGRVDGLHLIIVDSVVLKFLVFPGVFGGLGDGLHQFEPILVAYRTIDLIACRVLLKFPGQLDIIIGLGRNSDFLDLPDFLDDSRGWLGGASRCKDRHSG